MKTNRIPIALPSSVAAASKSIRPRKGMRRKFRPLFSMRSWYDNYIVLAVRLAGLPMRYYFNIAVGYLMKHLETELGVEHLYYLDSFSEEELQKLARRQRVLLEYWRKGIFYSAKPHNN